MLSYDEFMNWQWWVLRYWLDRSQSKKKLKLTIRNSPIKSAFFESELRLGMSFPLKCNWICFWANIFSACLSFSGKRQSFCASHFSLFHKLCSIYSSSEIPAKALFQNEINSISPTDYNITQTISMKSCLNFLLESTYHNFIPLQAFKPI